MKTVEDDIKLVNEVYGSWDNLHEFLRSEIARLCPIICGKVTYYPQVQAGISANERDLLLGSAHRRVATYEPEYLGLWPMITIFPTGYANKHLATLVLAHELIHHWEFINRGRYNFRYPKGVDSLIRDIFQSAPYKERSWRATHSENFIAKASKVAKVLDIPLGSFLVYGSKLKPERKVQEPALTD
ncbi:MAG: hypothetical protein L0209_08380 [candidate division Zixibacteria bacterium]|nr:hypothetical protein [candidate division Zixibacteria bacterium]